MIFTLLILAVGCLLVGGLWLFLLKAFNAPLIGPVFLPVRVLLVLLFGFCTMYTLVDVLRRLDVVDLRAQVEARFGR